MSLLRRAFGARVRDPLDPHSYPDLWRFTVALAFMQLPQAEIETRVQAALRHAQAAQAAADEARARAERAVATRAARIEGAAAAAATIWRRLGLAPEEPPPVRADSLWVDDGHRGLVNGGGDDE